MNMRFTKSTKSSRYCNLRTHRWDGVCDLPGPPELPGASSVRPPVLLRLPAEAVENVSEVCDLQPLLFAASVQGGLLRRNGRDWLQASAWREDDVLEGEDEEGIREEPEGGRGERRGLQAGNRADLESHAGEEGGT